VDKNQTGANPRERLARLIVDAKQHEAAHDAVYQKNNYFSSRRLSRQQATAENAIKRRMRLSPP
jgi:hypothetical protein